MSTLPRFPVARLLALLVPALLLAGAWYTQLVWHLTPCEMCHWQRWPHYTAVVLAVLAFVAPVGLRRPLVWLAALAIAVSGAIGVFHAGVEYHWWQGFTSCSSTMSGRGMSADDMLTQMMHAPVVLCDVPQWTFHGFSLAGFNAVLSLGFAAVIAGLLLPRRER